MWLYKLIKGGQLKRHRYVQCDDDELPQHQQEDVTFRAEQFLFESVEVDPDVTLSDLLKLASENDIIRTVLHRYFIDEFIEEYHTILSRPSRERPTEPGLDYLQLRRCWEINEGGNIRGIDRLQLIGIQEEPPRDGALEKGSAEPVEWCVALSELEDLINLPVRLKADITGFDNDIDSPGFGKSFDVFGLRAPDATLGQILEGVFWELCSHGGPVTQRELAERLIKFL